MDCLTNLTEVCSQTDLGSHLLLQLLNTLILSTISLKPEYPADRCYDHLPEYDFIVVGAGSAGSPLAASLASNPDWNVLLIEAGDDPHLNAEIPLLFLSIQKTDQDWQYLTAPQKNACLAFKNHQCAWPRGKVVGGTSGINGLMYNMGNPRDYDEWEHMGNVGWGWKDVKEYFENQMNYTIKPKPFLDDKSDDIYAEMRQAILNAGQEIGFQIIHHPVEKSQSYVGVYDILGTVENGQRLSAARAYLTPIAKQQNFHVIKNGIVTKVLIDKTSKQVQGVQVFLNNKFVEIGATKEVILSAGTVNTPQILMLSGIGPEKHLKDLNIDPVQNLSVGDHLEDHVSIMIPVKIHQDYSDAEQKLITNETTYKYFMKREGPLRTTGLFNMITNLNPKDPQSKVGEITFHYIYVAKNDDTEFLNHMNFDDEFLQHIKKTNQETPLLFIFIILLRPKSEGSIRLKSNDPFTAPIIDSNYNSNFEDIEMLLVGYRYLQKLLSTDAMKSQQAELLKLEFDACNKLEYDSDEYWVCLIKHMSSTYCHPVGSARMGTNEDSVVDPRLRVRGITGLRVADGSIMPKIVGGNTNAPIIMIGEKAGDMIKEDWLHHEHSEL